MSVSLRGVATLALVTLWAAGAPAQTPESHAPPVHLAWRAPPGCGQGAEIVARTERLLGSWRPTEPLEAEGTVEGTPGQHLTLELAIGVGSERRVRRVEATTCEEISRASSVVLAIAVHPELASSEAIASFERDASTADEAAGAEAPPTATQEPEGTHQPAPAGADSTRARSSTTRNAAWRRGVAHARVAEPGPASHARTSKRSGLGQPQAVAGMGPAAAVGVFRGVAFGLTARAALDLGPLSLGIRGDYVPTHDITTDSPAWARFSVRSVGMRLCWLFPADEHLHVGSCLGADFGKIRGQGQGIAGGREATRDWSALGPGLQLRWDFWRLVSLETGIDAVVSLQRPRFFLAGDQVMQPGRVGLWGFAAASMHFP